MVGEAFTKRAGLSIMLGTVRYYHGTLKSNDLVFFVTLRYSRYWKNPFALHKLSVRNQISEKDNLWKSEGNAPIPF